MLQTFQQSLTTLSMSLTLYRIKVRTRSKVVRISDFFSVGRLKSFWKIFCLQILSASVAKIYHIRVLLYFKTLFKGKNFAVRRVREGVNFILITTLRFWPNSWKYRTFWLVASFSALREQWDDHFQKKFVQNGLSLQILSNWAQKYFIYFWQKKWSFVLFVCCNTLSDFGLLFFKLKHLSSWERCFKGKYYLIYSLGIAQPRKYSYSADLLDIQKCNWSNL